jgi:hypothetical protein
MRSTVDQTIQSEQPAAQPQTTGDQPRATLMRAFSVAEQVVSQLRTVPTDVDVRGDSVSGTYGVHLFFSRDSQGVMECAQAFDAEVTSSPSKHTAGVFLDARTRYQGVEVTAWTIVDEAPDPDAAPSGRTVDEDPIAYTLTEAAEEQLGADA